MPDFVPNRGDIWIPLATDEALTGGRGISGGADTIRSTTPVSYPVAMNNYAE